ncbi:hypothetical protein NW762_013751 [Fusarium torreyae]|uniref:NACHT domain-containing protein n=1 Tax=Fusarium torreyae TaxID=1237075 RepID=A0A9W8RK03_9HYPO|nr:hypothetical protein NW762_013751 [Fusarium torreyae]
MDPLSALGVAAAVIQFVDFGQRLLSETWHIYRDAAGQDIELRELSIVSRDLAKVAQAVRDTIAQQEASQGVSQHADTLLLNIDASFKTQLESGNQSEIVFLFKKDDDKRLSIGDAFRKALKSLWKGREIENLRARFDKIHQQMMTAATMSIWLSSRDTKGWETQFSNKLDTMIETLNHGLEKTVDMGPGRVPIKSENLSPNNKIDSSFNIQPGRFMPMKESKGRDGSSYEGLQKGRGDGVGPIEPRAIESIRNSRVAEEIILRLWKRDWKPDSSILSTFPRESSTSVNDVKSSIIGSLCFSSINNREEAITPAFQSTYQWVFSRTPNMSSTGEPMWSSLPNWLESDCQAPYWITGKPGAGKSTVMKYIANHPAIDHYLSKWAAGYPIYKVKYYAWKPGLELGKSEQGLLRTLLHQTLQKNPRLTPVICPRRWALFHTIRDLEPQDLPPWSDWELHESFAHLLSFSKTRMRFVVFVDGLDEFDVAPMQLCTLIQRVAQHKAIKVCVASRSWPQFSDAFADSPGMQMHLLTHDDIKTYVFGHFKGVRAFLELNSLYQNRGDQLLNHIVSKAHGVFLWTAIVTQTIFQSLVEGASLSQLQTTLDKIPPELESLYDAIYSAIPARLLPEVSVMLQIHVSACSPLDWLTLWLADETRGARVNINVHALDMDQMHLVLRRRLGARTRGILEAVKTTQTVDFLHRTAAEWIKQPRVWERIRSASPQGFDPCICLLRAEIIKMENLQDETPLGSIEFWNRIMRSLLYASLADQNATPDKTLVETVDQLHQAVSNAFRSSLSVTDVMWPTYQPKKDTSTDFPSNSFHGLTAQFAILRYIRYKMDDHPTGFHPVTARGSRALLEQAIFGFQRYSASWIIAGVDDSRIPCSQRLDTIAYLVSKGIRQTGISSLLKEAELSSSKADEQLRMRYFLDVKHLLGQMNALEDKRRAYVKDKLERKIRKWFG